MAELAGIFEALCPYFHEDKEARVLLGQFFASVASPELLLFKNGDGEVSWSLSATGLCTDKLMGFSLDAMERKIASDAPGLSSFLDGICNGRKLDGCSMDVDDNDAEGDAESETEAGTESRQRVSPAQLLKIVSLFACYIFVAHLAIEEGYYCKHHPEHTQSEVQCISGCDRCFPPFDAYARPCHPCSPPHWYQHFFAQYTTCHQIHVSKDN